METLSADLTRFDFHVNRFLDSEDVQQMTAEEVGQYILLLCEAWKLHKGATLPDNDKYLGRVARGAVSPLVMKKFTLIEVEVDGIIELRYRNKRLHEEWQKAMGRYQRFRESGRNGAEKRWGAHSQPIGEPNDQANSHPTAIPYHSIPTHYTHAPTQEEIAKIEQTGRERRLKELEELDSND